MDAMQGALDFLQGLDDGHDERYGTLARALCNNLFALLRTGGMHDLDNDALLRPYAMLSDTVNELLAALSEEVHLQLVDGNFFINKRMVKLDFSTFENVRYLRRIFEFLGINELSFTQKLDGHTLRDFLTAFLKVVGDGQGRITDYKLGTIKVRKLEAVGTALHLEKKDPRSHILSLYASGLLMLRQFTNDLRKGRSPRHAQVKRLCLELIDVEPRRHNVLLALAHLEAYKGNLFCHMLNTAVLSICFGVRIGLTKRQLVDLGMSAFHHDLGWALLGTLDDERLSDDEVVLSMDGINYIRDHSPVEMDDLRVKVARALVRIGGFNELIINRLIVAYECQIPEEDPPDDLYYGDIGASFMTHVVRMASTYDELTSPRGDKPALRPDQAMKRILDDGGVTFDAFLAKVFVNCIGVYPVGTMVELDTTEIGLVVNLPSNPINFHRPQVKLLVDRMGKAVEDGEIVDLDQRYRGGGKYLRTIERTLDSRDYGVSITKFFFG